jgi:hypothetical protein
MFAFNSSVLDQGLPKGGNYSTRTVNATSEYSQQPVVWGVFMWFGKRVVARGREGGGGETAGPRPSGAFPPSAVTTPLAHSDSFAASCVLQSPQNFFHQQRAAAICLGAQPCSRSVAACLALGDNVLSVPRKRERTVVCRLLSHSAQCLRPARPPRAWSTSTRSTFHRCRLVTGCGCAMGPAYSRSRPTPRVPVTSLRWVAPSGPLQRRCAAGCASNLCRNQVRCDGPELPKAGDCPRLA